MSNIILVEGESGSGKTTSIRTLNPKETYIISIISKDLPFKGWKTNYFPSTKTVQGNRKIIYDKDFTSASYGKDKQMFSGSIKAICDTLKGVSEHIPTVKTIVIDDSQFILAYEFLARAKETGFTKYNEIAQNFFDVMATAQGLRDDINVIFLHHTETVDGKRKAKTIGKLIDNSLTVEGLFTIVLLADCRKADGKIEYYFTTNTDGSSTAKSPMGMFPSEIPNDLQLVIDTIHKYNMGD